MASKLFLFTILLQITFIKCDIVKSSIALVIDSSSSMFDDLEQVKKGIDAVFDNVYNSKLSPIENFVLVPFNDPDVGLATVTRDRATFKRALDNIVVGGGGDCPEYSLSGIESALNNSLPESYIYVFTDASAKDYQKYEQVKRLAINKYCKIVFVLTGRCGNTEEEPGYQVYHKLAEATSGLVFNIKKNDINEVMDLVAETAKARVGTLAKRKFPAGNGHEMVFYIDEYIWDVIINIYSTSKKGTNTKLQVTGPDLRKDTQDCANFICMFKFNQTNPGLYTAEIENESAISVAVNGFTGVTFEYGFSKSKSPSMGDTSPRPLKGAKLYLLIKLNTAGNDEVKLTDVKFLNLIDETILENPLELLNDKEQIYATDLIDVPQDTLFYVVVVGHTVNNNSVLVRQSLRTIEVEDA